jgi:hypothetical protein
MPMAMPGGYPEPQVSHTHAGRIPEPWDALPAASSGMDSTAPVMEDESAQGMRRSPWPGPKGLVPEWRAQPPHRRRQQLLLQ